MTTLSSAVLLGCIHASIVALAALTARACLPRRWAGGRATIGFVGLGCVLAVTSLAALPLPGIPLKSSKPAAGVDASRIPGAEASIPTESAGEVSTAGETLQLPLEWLGRLGNGFEQATAAPGGSSTDWRAWAFVAVLAGATIGVGRLAVAYRHLARLRCASRLVDDAAVAATVEKFLNCCGCRRPIEIRATDEVASAATFGWLRPVILLPSDWSDWSADELAAVLAHEVAHVRRADFVQRIVALAGLAVYFYHPLVRCAARRLAVDQEIAADRLARTRCAAMRGLMCAGWQGWRCGTTDPFKTSGHGRAFRSCRARRIFWQGGWKCYASSRTRQTEVPRGSSHAAARLPW